MDEYDVIIIGAGPAGLTAGIYAGRQGLKTIILEKMMGGGSGFMIPMMQNYPGYDLISGKDLMEKVRKQAEKWAMIRAREEVESIKILKNKMKLKTSDNEHLTRSVIISTGSRHKELNVPGENDFIGQGVCYCAICDAPLFIGKKVVMVGGGNTAVQEALYLEDIGSDVTLVHRRDELRAEKYLQDQLREKEIPILWNSMVKEIKGDNKVKSVVLYNKKTDERSEMALDGVFIAIGEEPVNKLAADIGVELDREGYIVTDKYQRTNLPRVYAAGDITDGVRQWVVACAEGAIAAISAYNDLKINE